MTYTNSGSKGATDPAISNALPQEVRSTDHMVAGQYQARQAFQARMEFAANSIPLFEKWEKNARRAATKKRAMEAAPAKRKRIRQESKAVRDAEKRRVKEEQKTVKAEARKAKAALKKAGTKQGKVTVKRDWADLGASKDGWLPIKTTKVKSAAASAGDEDDDEQLPVPGIKMEVQVRTEVKAEGHHTVWESIKTERGPIVQTEAEVKAEPAVKIKIEALDE